jgi:hypothetical protein
LWLEVSGGIGNNWPPGEDAEYAKAFGLCSSKQNITQLLMLLFTVDERSILFMANVSENLYVNGDGFVFDYYTGLTYDLNHTGAFVLKQLLDGIPPVQIIRALEKKYGTSHETATIDLNDFLQQLANFKLLKPSEALPDDSM